MEINSWCKGTAQNPMDKPKKIKNQKIKYLQIHPPQVSALPYTIQLQGSLLAADGSCWICRFATKETGEKIKNLRRKLQRKAGRVNAVRAGRKSP